MSLLLTIVAQTVPGSIYGHLKLYFSLNMPGNCGV